MLAGALSGAESESRVEIDFSNRAQTLEGWGTSLAWWAYSVGDWEEENLDRLIHAIVDPEEGLGLNVFRYNIGGGDHPDHDHMRPYGDVPGYQIQEDGPYDWDADAGQVRVLRKLAYAAEDPILEAFSNSPPWWMTHSGCASGAEDGGQNLKREYESAFAEYLVDVVKHLNEEQGITFGTLEPLNEPNANWWRANGSQEGCFIPEDQQARLIQKVGKALEGTDLQTVVSASDASSLNLGLRNLLSYDEETLKYLGQFNVHSYFGDRRVDVREAAAERGLALWQSESGPLNLGSSLTEVALLMADRIILDLNELQPVVWNIWQVLDSHRHWRHFELDRKNQSISHHINGQMLRQFTRFIRPGAVIVPTGIPKVLSTVSDERRQAVLVLVNASDDERERGFTLSGIPELSGEPRVYRTSENESVEAVGSAAHLDDRALTVALTPNSITSVVVEW